MKIKTLLITLFLSSILIAQKQEYTLKGISIKPSEDISIGIHAGSQVWVRYMQTNPGTVGEDGQPVDKLFDIGLRRTRYSMLADMYKEKIVLYSQFGMNGQTSTSVSKPQMYVHDIWSQFAIIDKILYVGAGLHGWAGVSRLGSISYTKNLMVDHPGFGLPNLGKTDQSGRQIGVFFRGNVANMNYRFSIDKPFVEDGMSNISLNESVYCPNIKTAYKCYVYYSFLDEEHSKSSYLSLTHLGSKKIINIGAGFDFHPRCMASLNEQGDTLLHNKVLVGADVFIDYPYENKSAITFYVAGYNFNFGPNYVQTYGAMNPLKSGMLEQGGGNAHYNVGTGTIIYTSVGYLLPESLQFGSGMLQLAGAMHYKNFEALAESSTQFEGALHYYLSNHKAKVSLQYSTWNVYKGTSGYNSDAKIDSMKGMLVFQTQIYL